jgi:methionine-rich copper-binding protein CopC
MAATQWTLEQVIAQLVTPHRWTSANITYSFPTLASGLYGTDEQQGFRPIGSQQQAIVVLALQLWDDLVPQNIVPGTPGQTSIEFGYTSTGIGFAHAYFPQVGSTWFNVGNQLLVNPTVGEYGFLTFIHEIGHALGLEHMGDYNGEGNWSPSSYQDSVVLSVMSYFGPRGAAAQYSPNVFLADWTDNSGLVHKPQTPMVNDVLAIQAMYGASTNTRPGDTVYGFNSNVVGSLGQILDFRLNANPIVTLFDSDGNDTLDLSGWSTSSLIDLRPGAYSSANSMTNNIAIAYGAVIENATGGAGSDVLIGNDAANRLEGGAGNDELFGRGGDDILWPGSGNDSVDGGGGTDTLVLGLAFGAYSVSVIGSTIVLTASGASTRINDIERFVFTDGERSIGQLTGADSLAPWVVSLSPSDDSVNVAPGTRLVLEFSEPIKAATSGSVSILSGGGNVVFQFAINDTTRVNIDGSRVLISPPAPLSPGSYSVQVSSGALTDRSGNAFAGIVGPTAWNFSVAAVDTTAPRLLDFTPDDESTGVAGSAGLMLVFDEAVTRGSGNITLRDNSGIAVRTISVADSSQVQFNGSTVNITPAGGLPSSTRLTVTVESRAILDLAGNAWAGLTDSTAWNFTTQAPVSDDYPFSASTTGRVVVGAGPVRGVIETVDDIDAFKVDLVAGRAYVFELSRALGGLADPVLSIYGLAPDLRLLASDDDSGVGGNARLIFTAPTSGTYYLAAMDWGAGLGAYNLSASTTDNSAPSLLSFTPADDSGAVPPSSDLVLTFSENVVPGSGSIRLLTRIGTVAREISASDTSQVRIVGSTVTINLSSDLTATTYYVVNIDADAFRDVPGNRFAGLSGTSAWNFTTASAPQADDYPLGFSTSGRVFPGGPVVSGRIDSASDGDLFMVELVAGTTYRFEMSAAAGSQVDPFLSLYGPRPEAELLHFDDDSGGSTAAMFYFTPSQGGTHYLAAFDYAEATGGYRLQVQVPADDHQGSIATLARLTMGAVARQAQIGAPTDIDTFGVDLVAGRSYTFDLRRNGPTGLDDPFLSLYDREGRILDIDDDSGGGLNARLTFSPSVSGTYFVSASDYELGTGGYTIRVFQRVETLGTFGTIAAETLRGTSASERFTGGGGDDLILGGAGIDTAVYLGAAGQHVIEQVDRGWVVEDLSGSAGIDNLVDIERVVFGGDVHLALDIEGHAGTAALILGAVFRMYAKSDALFDDYLGVGLWALDSGQSPQAVVDLALKARLGATFSHGAVVQLLYRNVFGSDPAATEFQYFKSLLDAGTYTPAELGWLACLHERNQANVDLVGLGLEGLVYIPYGG